MKKYVFSLMTLFMVQSLAHAEDIWTKFNCVQPGTNKSLLFIPETSEAEAKQCTFFDGKIAWNYRVIVANGDSYRVTLHSGCSHEYLKPNALAAIEFSLPEDRQIKRYQRGGYYIPDMVTLPLNFNTIIVGKNARDEVLFSESFSCSGAR